MNLRIFIACLFSFALGVSLFAVLTPHTSRVNAETQTTTTDDRKADREAIRAHIDRIFQAFIKKDAAELRATHAENWLGYLQGSTTMIRGVNGYMEWNDVSPSNQYGMKSYNMREFDMIFKGDAAFVCFTAEVESNTPTGPSKRLLRIADFYTKQDGHWIQTGSDTELHPDSAAQQFQTARTLSDQGRKKLLAAREAVWRSYFANDRSSLEKLIPDETIAIEAGDNSWSNRKSILEGAEQFAKSGGKLIKLEFPRTEIQVYGYTAIVYSNYTYELEMNGQTHKQSGRVTEVFVSRNGEWVNPGWHMDTGSSGQ
jgi:ketosteroid isomerase-like protein